MARPTISKEQEARGKRLAEKIKASRGTSITQEQLAQMAGVPLDKHGWLSFSGTENASDQMRFFLL